LRPGQRLDEAYRILGTSNPRFAGNHEAYSIC
jgi:hypothetical protein